MELGYLLGHEVNVKPTVRYKMKYNKKEQRPRITRTKKIKQTNLLKFKGITRVDWRFGDFYTRTVSAFHYISITKSKVTAK